jgi:hypothetical protein
MGGWSGSPDRQLQRFAAFPLGESSRLMDFARSNRVV